MKCPSHSLGTTWKHIAMKKPKKSGSEYDNYKGFFCLVLQALLKFLWEDVGSSGSSSEVQIFNCIIVLLAPEPLGEGRPDLDYFLLGYDAFALMPWLVKPYSRRQLKREGRIANYIISRGRRVVENVFGILGSIFRVLLGRMKQGPKLVRGIVLTCVPQHTENTPR